MSSTAILIKTLRGIKTVLKDQLEVPDSSSEISGVSSSLEEIRDELKKLNNLIEFDSGTKLSDLEKQLMERVEVSIASYNNLERDIGDVIWSIQNNGYASIAPLGSENIRDFLAEKYPICSTAHRMQSGWKPCGKCFLTLFANNDLLNQHLERRIEEEKEKTKKVAEQQRKRREEELWNDVLNDVPEANPVAKKSRLGGDVIDSHH
jgi:hypothetical protein